MKIAFKLLKYYFLRNFIEEINFREKKTQPCRIIFSLKILKDKKKVIESD